VLAFSAGLSRAVQASAYEGCRRNYRRWVYGARWIRQTLAVADPEAESPLQRFKVKRGLAYVVISRLVSADDRALEAAMERATDAGGEAAASARRLYRQSMLPVVKRASVLSANYRSLAAFLSVLAGVPVAFLLYELVALNAALVLLGAAEARANRGLIRALAPSETGPASN
jgi:hypothetical protein